MGDIHEHPIHRRRCDGVAAQATSAAVPSEFGRLVAASLVGAVTGEALDVLFAALTARVRGRPIGDVLRTFVPVVFSRAGLRADRCSPRLHVRPSVALDARALPRAGDGRATPLRPVPGAATTGSRPLRGQRNTRAREPSVRRRPDRNARRAGSLHGGPLGRSRDLLARHRSANGACRRDSRSGIPLRSRARHRQDRPPPGLLEKPGALTLEERRQMQEHSAIGERILAHVDEYSEIATIVRHHHERIDGQGYPDGLVDEDIPLVSRIIAVADAYNAMTSDRPYRDAMPSRVARLRLAQAVEASSTPRQSRPSRRSLLRRTRTTGLRAGPTSVTSRRSRLLGGGIDGRGRLT